MKFYGHIIIVGDMGELKAYRVTSVTGIDSHESMQVSHTQHRGTPKEAMVLETVSYIDYLAAHGKMSEHVSDKTGRFGNATGEPHNTGLEKENSILKQISDDIASIINKENPAQWNLAFPKANNHKLYDKLDPKIKKTLNKNLASDLTKIDKSNLLSHFE